MQGKHGELLSGWAFVMVVRIQAKLVPQWLLGHNKWPTAQETSEAKGI